GRPLRKKSGLNINTPREQLYGHVSCPIAATPPVGGGKSPAHEVFHSLRRLASGLHGNMPILAAAVGPAAGAVVKAEFQAARLIGKNPGAPSPVGLLLHRLVLDAAPRTGSESVVHVERLGPRSVHRAPASDLYPVALPNGLRTHLHTEPRGIAQMQFPPVGQLGCRF